MQWQGERKLGRVVNGRYFHRGQLRQQIGEVWFGIGVGQSQE